MSNAQPLMEAYAHDYMEKVFYFCLRKCGQVSEAEDLASDITCQILTALHRGQEPTHFSGWVWRIAKNRYSRWAERRHRQGELMTDELPPDLPDDDTFYEDDGQTEQLALLRRELAFIREDYRTILVAYYLENRRVQDIADALGIPKGTVTSKLQRARQHLKEGMNMAREFGKRSYNPEEITFSNSCSSFGNEGQPWSVLNHLMYKNIFLEVYDNPETAEELAMEMGIALPYMQSELDFLVAETFLIREDTPKGAKYQTAFPIISKDAQVAIHQKRATTCRELVGLCETLIDRYAAICASHGIDFMGKGQAYETAKWTLLMEVHRVLQDKAIRSLGIESHNGRYTERPSDGLWDIIGFQDAKLSKAYTVGMHGSSTESRPDLPPAEIWEYKFIRHGQLINRTPQFLKAPLVHTLREVVCGRADGCAQAELDQLTEHGYLRKTEAGYEAAIIVFNQNLSLSDLSAEEQLELHSLTERIMAIYRDVISFTDGVTVADLPPIMKNNEHLREFARKQMYWDRSYLVEQALADGWLTEGDATALGAHMEL